MGAVGGVALGCGRNAGCKFLWVRLQPLAVLRRVPLGRVLCRFKWNSVASWLGYYKGVHIYSAPARVAWPWLHRNACLAWSNERPLPSINSLGITCQASRRYWCCTRCDSAGTVLFG